MAAQPSFMAALGLSADGAPTMLVLSPKKARGARLTGAFDAAGLNALVDGLLSGRVPTTAFQARCGFGWQTCSVPNLHAPFSKTRRCFPSIALLSGALSRTDEGLLG